MGFQRRGGKDKLSNINWRKMQNVPTTSAELANYAYIEIQPKVYSYRPGERMLFVEPNESARLIIRSVPVIESNSRSK